MSKVSLYYHTIKNMKPSQIVNQFRKKIGLGCPLEVKTLKKYGDIEKVKSPELLDFDPTFIKRYPADDFMEDMVSFLHSSKTIDWKSNWLCEDKTALWNYNLHYFDFIFSLIKKWRDTGCCKYLTKTEDIINGWIDNNQIGSYPGWDSYPTSLRIVNWIGYYGCVEDSIPEDFKRKLLSSLHDQYIYLATHLEKDKLGNHYFENLKALVIASIFFKDDTVLNKSLSDFKKECREEVLSDGMHFELSPMYHKIILEGVLRIAVALKYKEKGDTEIQSYLQPMIDVAYSFEDGLERIPLFNDGGNNVAKSLNALIATVDQYFGLKPRFVEKLDVSGFYIFRRIIHNHKWRLIVDAGQPGPKYIPGHAHCDAMSFELFCDGKPVIVNCGTYAYQCRERSFFRSTSAHNTAMVEGIEQSQCWGSFRLARRSRTKVINVDEKSIIMELTDQKGNIIKREIRFEDSIITIRDTSDKPIRSFIHLLDDSMINMLADGTKTMMPYAEDYGEKRDIETIIISGKTNNTVSISLK